MLDQCPVCHSSNLIKTINYPRPKGSEFYTEIINCESCKSGIALPYKNQVELNRFYDSGAYWDSASSNNLSIHTLTQAEVRVQYVLKRTTFKSRDIHTLDIGAGHGHVGAALKNIDPILIENFSYIEPDNKLSKFIQSNFPLAKRRTFTDSSYKYDLIFLNHILEHTASPSDTLKNYASFLNEDGRIYIEVPHRDDQFKNDVFPHSIFFSKQGLKTMIEQCGLKCLEINCFGSLEGVQAPTKLINKVRFKLIGKIYLYSVKYGFTFVAKLMDKILFDYKTERSDGIWIRALCSK